MTPQELAALSHYPLPPPPAGVQSNFANPKNRNRPFFIVDSLLLGVMAAFFLNRIYAKTYIIRKYSWDDCKPHVISSGISSLLTLMLVTVMFAVVSLIHYPVMQWRPKPDDRLVLLAARLYYLLHSVHLGYDAAPHLFLLTRLADFWVL